jgi:peptidoglycan/LPS O-acetylase OafA/YrhL
MVLPVIALRGVDPAQWDPPGDFVFLALLLAGVGLTYEAAARVSDAKAYRAGVVVALATALLSAWINLAVGIIGSEDNPANWIYAGVLAVAGAGAVFARFRPFGVARAMAVAAAAQILAFVIALVAGFGFTGPITVFFAGLWLISAWLFARAAREQGS